MVKIAVTSRARRRRDRWIKGLLLFRSEKSQRPDIVHDDTDEITAEALFGTSTRRVQDKCMMLKSMMPIAHLASAFR